MIMFKVKNFERFQHYKDRAPPWIKLYNELLDDYEFGSLPDATKMHLIAIWLLASRSENKIPFDPKWVGRRINANDAVNLQLLVDRGFILLDQPLQTTEHVASNPIAERLSRERVEGETEESREELSPVAKTTRQVDAKFEEFWKERPRRDGDDPRKPAEKKFKALVKTGVDPDVIISGAKLAAAAARERGNYGTKFVPQTVKWLNDQRFIDYAAAAFTEADETKIDWDNQVSRYKRGFQWSGKWFGPEPGMAGCRVPVDILAKHGYLNEPQDVPPIHINSMQ
jgi:hypothetical protein